MKMNKKKILIIAVIFLICIFFISQAVQATAFDPDHYQPDPPSTPSGATKLGSIANKIIGVVHIIGSTCSAIALIVIGIKYMAGSIEERAEYKKTMMPYVIGALLVFGITNILGIVSNITDGLL